MGSAGVSVPLLLRAFNGLLGMRFFMHKRLSSHRETFALVARKLRYKSVASETLVCIPVVFSLPTEYPCNATKIFFGTRQGVFFFLYFFKAVV